VFPNKYKLSPINPNKHPSEAKTMLEVEKKRRKKKKKERKKEKELNSIKFNKIQ
jgi:hypothetical protein